MNTTASNTAPQESYAGAFESLIEATNAFKNYRALLLLGATFLCAALVAGLFAAMASAMSSAFLGAVGALLAFVVLFYGVNAVGILLMREAQGMPADSMLDAVLVSLFTSHRALGVALLGVAIIFLSVIIVAALLFVCKIPGLGPFLFTFVYPISAVFLGLLVFSLFYVMFPLAGPAIWSGCTVFETIARLNAIARSKLVSVILMEVFLFLITGFVAGLIFTVVFLGIAMTTGLSASILSVGFGLGDLMGTVMGGGLRSGGDYAIGAGFGGGLLVAVAAIVPALIFSKGLCIIYLAAVQGVDFAANEASLNERFASVKKKAEEARDRAKALTEQKPKAIVPASQGYAPLKSASFTCPNCQASVAADDAFCGNCAHKLK